PDAALESLIAAERAQPAALLEELQRLAAADDAGHGETLRSLHELAATIRVHGVLVPIRLAQIDGRYVVEEGHRRTLAALLAGLDPPQGRGPRPGVEPHRDVHGSLLSVAAARPPLSGGPRTGRGTDGAAPAADRRAAAGWTGARRASDPGPSGAGQQGRGSCP